MIDLGGLLLEVLQEDVWLTVYVFLLFVHACPRRPRFVGKAAVGFTLIVLLSAAHKLLERRFPQELWIQIVSELDLALSLILIGLCMKLLFSCNWNMLLFGTLAGLCAQELMFGLWALLKALIPALDMPMGELSICLVLGVGLAAALYWFLARKLTVRSLQVLARGSLIPLLLLYLISMLLIYFSTNVVVFLNVFFEPVQAALKGGSTAGRFSVGNVRLSAIFASMAGNLMVLLALKNMLRYSEADLERELLEQIREQDRKQYARFRDNVDYINTKSHDLKHYLELLERGQALPERELRQVSESLQKLDSETDSGNETLDLILTDRRLACERQGIELIFQTDGTRLEELDVIDTYSVFCNILDNAIEYAGKLPKEKRRIRLGLRTIRSMVFIHQENYLEEELEIKDGLPATTQEDELLHGFGLKSVRDIVRKRGGELFVRAESGRFELDICFPNETG